MPINVFQIIPCNKSIVCFIHFIIYIFLNGVLCITLPHRRGSRPDGACYDWQCILYHISDRIVIVSLKMVGKKV